MIRDGTLEPKPAETAVGEIEMHLLAQPPIGTDAKAIADQKHPDHQLRVDRWPPRLAAIGPQVLSDIRQIDEAVDPPQQVIIGNMTPCQRVRSKRPCIGLPMGPRSIVVTRAPEGANSTAMPGSLSSTKRLPPTGIRISRGPVPR